VAKLSAEVRELKLDQNGTLHTTTYADYFSSIKLKFMNQRICDTFIVYGHQLFGDEFEKLKEGKENMIVQPSWTELVKSTLPSMEVLKTSSYLYDSHQKKILEGKKPDIVGLRWGGSVLSLEPEITPPPPPPVQVQVQVPIQL
jgi:hypothetical protein